MALLFVDSFDHYATADLLEKWTSSTSTAGLAVSVAPTGGRRGSGSARISGSSFSDSNTTHLRRLFAPADATCVVGCAVQVSTAAIVGASGLPLLTLRDGAAVQLTLRLNADLTLSVLRGMPTIGTVLGTTSSGLSAATFAYVEWKTLIHPSAGTVDVRLNGASVLSLTGQNTRDTATTSWNGLTLGPVEGVSGMWNGFVAVTLDWDDLYVCDGTGAAPWNSVLGDCRVDVCLPTGAGASTAWTPLAGANYAAVDEVPPDDDTTYTSTATIGATDTFVYQDAALAGATIYGVQHCLNLKKTDAGACTIAPVVRHSGVDYPGAGLAPATAYAYGLQVAATNPGTGVAWTEAGFNAAEFGYTRTG